MKLPHPSLVWRTHTQSTRFCLGQALVWIQVWIPAPDERRGGMAVDQSL